MLSRLLALFAFTWVACSTPVKQGPPAASSQPARAPASRPARPPRLGTEEEIAFCVDETNRYRARAKKPPFRRTAALDRFAAAGAEHDAQRRAPHDHFSNTELPDTFSGLAENELPWWHLDPDEGAVKRVLRAGLASMWAEGPGGGHYQNLVGPFTEMGCGINISGEEITVVQDFRTP